jgi:hypothetical protein
MDRCVLFIFGILEFIHHRLPPCEFEHSAPKIGEFQIGSRKQNDSAVAVLIRFQ